MPCIPIPGGVICVGRQRRVNCSVPGCTNPSEFECDFPIAGKASPGTCDAKLCSRCVKHIGKTDACPPHAKLLHVRVNDGR